MAPNDFNMAEILVIAERLEKNGAEFYHRAAGMFGFDQAMSDLLLDLAAMEIEHQAVFHEMRENLPAEIGDIEDYGLGREAALYLGAMADGIVIDFNADPADLLKGVESIEQILEIAIRLEKDSIVLYTGIKEMMSPALGGDKIDDIIREEMKHVYTLSRQLRKIKG